MRHSIVAFIAIAVLFTSPAICQAITIIDASDLVPGSVPGSTITSPTGIDGSNIVGCYEYEEEVEEVVTRGRGFLYAGSNYTTIVAPGTPEDRATHANDIQDSKIVGDWWDSADQQHGFILDLDGLEYTTFDKPGAIRTTLRGIDGNNMVGGFSNDGTPYQGFLYDRTLDTYTTIIPPGSTQTQVQDIDGGWVTGFFKDVTDDFHGFIYDIDDEDPFTIIDFPNQSLDNDTRVYGTDGVSVVGHGIFKAFVYTDSEFTQLAVPGARNTYLYDIQGTTVVGKYTDSDSSTHAFVADISELVLDADFDEDGDMDGNDFLAWQTGYGIDSNATHMDGDADGDGDVENDDFLAWQTQFGRIAGGPAGAFTSLVVPEPTAGAIATFILLSVFSSRCCPTHVHHRVAESQ